MALNASMKKFSKDLVFEHGNLKLMSICRFIKSERKGASNSTRLVFSNERTASK